MALLAIEGMQFYAFHGYYEAEQKAGGNYSVDVYVDLPTNAGMNDALENTLNYESIFEIVKTIMETPVKLIEYLAQKILAQLRSDFPQVEKFKVRVKKHHPPLSGEVLNTFFELEG